MTDPSSISGREFDWFARDSSGALAILATAGSGDVPSSVLEELEFHDATNELIPVSGWGSPAVWESYAAVGLFAYDWHAASRTYRRVTSPCGPMLASLRAALDEARLAKFNGQFSQTVELSIGELQHGA